MCASLASYCLFAPSSTSCSLQLGLPVAHERLAHGDYRLLGGDPDRQDLEARRVGRGHHLGDRRKVDLERVDMPVFHADALGEPLGERLDGERLVRRLRALQLLVGEHDERVLRAAVVAPLLLHLVGVGRLDQLVGEQPVDQLDDRQAVLARLGIACLRLRRRPGFIMPERL